MIADLYRIRVGPQSYLYTTAQEPRTHNSETYEPLYVQRDATRGTSEIARQQIKVRVPRDEGFAAQFAPGPPSQVSEIEIYQQDEDDTKLVYVGRVLTVAFSGSEAILSCESILTSQRQAGLRRHYQKRCTHTLYDSNCRVDRNAFRVVAEVTVSGNQITASEFGSKQSGWFTGGDIEYGDGPDRRAIIAHSGDTITLATTPTGLESGDTVEAFAGCDHLEQTCKDKFGNFVNYGGFPQIPNKNPFGDEPVF